MTTDDIVVVGTRPTSSGLGTATYTFAPNASGAEVEAYDPNAFQLTGELNISVRIKVDSSNTAKAKEAAKNVGDALSNIVAAGSALASTTLIPLPNGQSITVGQILSDIKQTKFIVTDVPSTNGGKGSADRSTMTDSLYFAAFVEGSGQTSYTNAHFLGQGMNGIMLHEISHLTQAGYDNLVASRAAFAKENTTFKLGWPASYFWSSPYGSDNELFAHEAGLAMGSQFNLPLNVYDGLFKGQYSPSTYRGPTQVYLSQLENH